MGMPKDHKGGAIELYRDGRRYDGSWTVDRMKYLTVTSCGEFGLYGYKTRPLGEWHDRPEALAEALFDELVAENLARKTGGR